MTFRIDPKTLTFDANERSRLIAACTIAKIRHDVSIDRCDEDGRAFWDHTKASAALDDLITKLEDA